MFILVGSVTDFNLHCSNGGNCVTNLLFVNVPAKAFANKGATTLLTVNLPAFCKPSATSFVNGRSDERLTDSVIDPETSLASERVLGSGHVEPDQNPQLIDYEAEAEAFRNALAQLAGGVGDPAPVVETSVLDHILTPDLTPERI